MSILWSETGLPNPTQRYTGDSSTPTLVTEMETGRKIQRRRFSRLNTTIRVSWVFTNEEFETFKEFFTEFTEGGLVWFEMPLPGEDYEDGDEILTKVRFSGSKYTYQYRPHARWEVSAQLEKYLDAGPAEAEANTTPLWYRPEISLVSNLSANPDIHRNALFKSNPGTGIVHIITVPAVGSLSDILPVGIELQGAGAVLVRTEGEESEGAGEETAWGDSIEGFLLSKTPWALWSGKSATVVSGSITQLNDLTGNTRHLTDSQDAIDRATLSANRIVSTKGGALERSFKGLLPSGTFPSKFRMFALMEMDTGFTEDEGIDTCYLFSNPGSSTGATPWLAIKRENATDPSLFTFKADTSGAEGSTAFSLSSSFWANTFLVEFQYKAGEQSTFLINGHLQPSGSDFYTGSTFSWTGLRLGKFNTESDSSSNYSDLKVLNVCIFDESTTEISFIDLLEIRRHFLHFHPTVGSKLGYSF